MCRPPAGPAAELLWLWIRGLFGPFDYFMFYRNMAIRVVGVAISGALELIALSQYRQIAPNESTGSDTRDPYSYLASWLAGVVVWHHARTCSRACLGLQLGCSRLRWHAQ
jgi:hypothetical protein